MPSEILENRRVVPYFDELVWRVPKYKQVVKMLSENYYARAGELASVVWTGVQIPRDIGTRFGGYFYPTKCIWIINSHTV